MDKKIVKKIGFCKLPVRPVSYTEIIGFFKSACALSPPQIEILKLARRHTTPGFFFACKART